ncbi:MULTISPECIES: DUF1064 domain-containing protein [Cytobacillus]|uniref:DUF1064 domain-containing protein n=1 Tax=Cytobacillus TaxID=2675230 RepID=UPI000DEA79C8|nr:DUF1064 domain-containing protein [Cytobacillus oceanisediminis]
MDDLRFDSQSYAKYYKQLNWLKQANQIKSFKLQQKKGCEEGAKGAVRNRPTK